MGSRGTTSIGVGCCAGLNQEAVLVHIYDFRPVNGDGDDCNILIFDNCGALKV